jgi:hypothetical protein
MPLDPPTRVTVTDHFEDGAGNPLGGRVVFRPSVTFKHNLAMVPAGIPTVAHLSPSGDISVQLVANDGPGVTPVGWTYDVTIQVGPQGALGDLGIDSFVRQDFSIKLPSLPGSVVLRSVTKVDPVPASAFEIKTVANVGPDVDGNVPLTASDLGAVGAGFATEAALDAVDTRVVTLENHPPNHAARHVPGGVDPLTGYVATALVGVSNGVASLDSGGKVPSAQLPSVALVDFLGAVASQAAMLGLTGQRGDWCTRTDLGTDWQLITEPSSSLASWREHVYPGSPVQSVAGKTGAVTLVKADVGLGSVDNTSDAAKPLSTAATTALAGKAATVHTHVIADVTGLQTAIDDTASFPSPESATLGDYVASIPRWQCISQDTLSNQFLTMYGAIALRAFTATKIRFHVRGAVGSPGIVTCALFTGSNRASLTKRNADITVTTQFGSIGPKELAITGVSLAKGDWCYLAMLHTNAGTDPALSTMPLGASADLLNPASTQVICGYKTAQTSIPASVDMTTGWTTYGRMAWWALAA